MQKNTVFVLIPTVSIGAIVLSIIIAILVICSCVCCYEFPGTEFNEIESQNTEGNVEGANIAYYDEGDEDEVRKEKKLYEMERTIEYYTRDFGARFDGKKYVASTNSYVTLETLSSYKDALHSLFTVTSVFIAILQKGGTCFASGLESEKVGCERFLDDLSTLRSNVHRKNCAAISHGFRPQDYIQFEDGDVVRVLNTAKNRMVKITGFYIKKMGEMTQSTRAMCVECLETIKGSGGYDSANNTINTAFFPLEDALLKCIQCSKDENKSLHSLMGECIALYECFDKTWSVVSAVMEKIKNAPCDDVDGGESSSTAYPNKKTY